MLLFEIKITKFATLSELEYGSHAISVFGIFLLIHLNDSFNADCATSLF